MFNKFNFYDFLGYLLPGASAIFIVYFTAKVAFGIALPNLPSDLSGSFAFLGASYVIGHLVQGAGSYFEDWIDRPKDKSNRRVRLGERLLLDDGPNAVAEPDFSNKVRDRVKRFAKDVFATESESEIFDLCQALIADKSVAQRTEIYAAQRGLARGMLMASVLAILLAVLVAIAQLAQRRLWEALASGLAIAVLIAAALLFHRGFMRFREYFAKSVYWAFLAWYGEQRFEGKQQKTTE